LVAHCHLLAQSFQHWTGRPLLDAWTADQDLAERLYQAPFALLSHDRSEDPCFTYVNHTAQRLWEMDWNAMIGMPSRQSAEAQEQAQRSQALGSAGQAGWVDGYTGVRISAGGHRFRIINGIIWSLVDAHGAVLGQAATFASWEYL